MNLSDTAKQLIKELGGHENVIDVTHCMTRLRFRLKNEDIVDDAKVKSLSGVLGVSRSGGQYQVIIGNAVATYYRAVTDVLGISGHTENTAPVSAGKKKWTAKRFFGNIIDAISGSVAPILPAIIGCGMIKLLLIILGLLGVPDTNMTYRVLEIVGDAAFYFLPIMVAYTAAKKFGCNPVLAMTLTGLLLHPDLIALFSADTPVTFLRLPVTAATYSSSIIPPLLCTWVLSYVEKGIDKITPTWTKTIFKPMLVLLIMAPVSLVALAPLGPLIGAWVQGLFAWLLGLSGWLTMGIFAALLPLIIMTGMHYAFVPGALSDIGTLGYDPFLLPAMLASNLAQGAACLAVMILDEKPRTALGCRRRSRFRADGWNYRTGAVRHYPAAEKAPGRRLHRIRYCRYLHRCVRRALLRIHFSFSARHCAVHCSRGRHEFHLRHRRRGYCHCRDLYRHADSRI